MSAKRLIWPWRPPMVWASMTPVLLTVVFSSCPAACVVSTTRPPSAWIMPPFWTSAFTAPWLTATLSRPSPARSRVIAVPPAMATVPRLAVIRPWLETEPPSSAT